MACASQIGERPLRATCGHWEPTAAARTADLLPGYAIRLPLEGLEDRSCPTGLRLQLVLTCSLPLCFARTRLSLRRPSHCNNAVAAY